MNFRPLNHFKRDKKEVFDFYLNKTTHAVQDFSHAIKMLDPTDEEFISKVIHTAALQTSKSGKIVTENSIMDALIDITEGPATVKGSYESKAIIDYFV